MTCFFALLVISLDEQKFLLLMKSSLLIFFPQWLILSVQETLACLKDLEIFLCIFF